MAGLEQVSHGAGRPLWRLLRASAVLTTTRHVGRALRAIAHETATLCEADQCTIVLNRREHVVRIVGGPAVSAAVREARRQLMYGTAPRLDHVPVFARARRDRKPVIVTTAVRDAMPAAWRKAIGSDAFVVLPLLHGSRCLGVMLLDNARTGRPVAGIRLDHARIVCKHVALALDHTPASGGRGTSMQEAEALLNVGTAMASSLDLSELVRRITREAARAIGADSAGIYVARDGSRSLEPLAAYHIPKSFLAGLRAGPIVRSEFDEILQRTRWSSDVPNDPAFNHPMFTRFPMRSLLLVPLKVRGSHVGMLVCAWWVARRRIAPDELRLMEAMAGQAAVAIEAAWVAARAERVAVGRERTRMDGLLHDTLSSTLFGLALKLDACLHATECSDELRGKLEAVKGNAKAMMGQIRGLLRAPTA